MELEKNNRITDEGNNVRDLVSAFAICNNVTPVIDDPDI